MLDSAISQRFVELIRQFDNTINQTLRSIVSDFSFSALALLVGISFIYGILHAIGPGHGKALVAAYFLKEKQLLKKSVLMSAIASLVHTFTAILLSLVLYYILTGIKGMLRIRMQSYFIVANGIMIILIALLFLYFKLRKKNETNLPPKWKNRNLVLVGISSGMIPCPVSSTIMLLTISNNVAHIGLITVFSISLGMFVVLTGVGLFSIATRSGLLTASGLLFNKVEGVSKAIEYTSLIVMLVIGAGMVLTYFII